MLAFRNVVPAMAAKLARNAVCVSGQRNLKDSISAKPKWDGPKGKEYPKHVATIGSLSQEQVMKVMDLALAMKKDPHAYKSALKDRTLLMMFEKPSLRTRVSLETGMTQLGGHGIYYALADSPLGKKESIQDTAIVASRFVDAMTARVYTRQAVNELIANSHVPVINALDDYAHPCQMLADLLTIIEHRGSFKGMKMAFVGDCQNNMTYDLMRLACLMGFHINVAGPADKGFNVEWSVVKECEELQKQYGGSFKIGNNRDEAVKGVDVVYCDSWMSYGIPNDERIERFKALMPYQIDAAAMALADKNAIFMNCLPAVRGEEQTADVLEGPQSVIYDQAENRLHAQKALITLLINGFDWKV